MSQNALADAVGWLGMHFPGTAASCGEAFPPFLPALAFAEAGLDDLLAYQSHFASGMDRRTRGAHAVAFYGHHLAIAAGAAFLSSGIVPCLDPQKLAVLFEPEGAGGVRRPHFRFSGAFLSGSAADFGQAFTAGLAPFIAAVRYRAGLAERASWRLAADGVAGAFLDLGTAMADAPRAMAAALEIVHARGALLSSPRTVFRRIDGAAGRSRIFRLRGGCCLSYRTQGGVFCDDCVLRSAESRRLLLAAHVDRAAEPGVFRG